TWLTRVLASAPAFVRTGIGRVAGGRKKRARGHRAILLVVDRVAAGERPMNSIRKAAISAAAIFVGFGTPAMAASEYPFEPGQYVEVSGIIVDDGHDLDYAKHLAGMWRKGQDFA